MRALLKVICFQYCSLDGDTLLSSQRLIFFPARHRDLNMPRCLFCALHWCPVGVLSLQKKNERILLTLASPGLASPSLKLTMPAPSARQRRGLCGMVQICACVRVCVFCEHVRVICKCVLVLVPYDSISAFQFQNTALTVLVEWASIQDQWTGSLKHTLVMAWIR